MEAVRKGASLFIDLKRHNVELREFGRRKPKRLMTDGEIKPEGMTLGLEQIETEEVARQFLRDLHHRFMHSIPTAEEAKAERRVRNIYYAYFRAPDKQSRADTLIGISRTESRAELTMAMLIFCIRGLLSDQRGGWAIRIAPGLVAKREWCVLRK